MEPTADSIGRFVDSSKNFARRLLAVGENRLELLMVEVQEERTRLMHAVLLALAVAVLGLLAILALNVALVVLFWNLSPIAVLLVFAGLYLGGAVLLYRRLTKLLGTWTTLSATLDQVRKDRECLEDYLA